MRLKNDPLPSEEEARIETDKRLKILKEIQPIFEEFCEAMIVVGSVAFGKNYSVRKSSDIDILLYINREDAEKIKECSLIKMENKYIEAIGYFIKGEVDHFSINTEKIEGVETQYHFWDKRAHFDAELNNRSVKVYNVWNPPGVSGTLRTLDLEGFEHKEKIKILKICEYGNIHDYSAYPIIDGKFTLRNVINNLLSDPDVLFSKDDQLYLNIDLVWDLIVRKMIGEEIKIDEENLLKFINVNWSFSPESKKRTEAKFEEALIRQGYSLDRL